MGTWSQILIARLGPRETEVLRRHVVERAMRLDVRELAAERACEPARAPTW